MYTTMTLGDKEYKLRLGAAQIMDLEKKLGGRNPLDVIMQLETSGRLPSLTATLHILHAAMQQFQHGLTFKDVTALYDRYVADGGSYTDLISEMTSVFEVSGFFPRRTDSTETESDPAILSDH